MKKQTYIIAYMSWLTALVVLMKILGFEWAVLIGLAAIIGTIIESRVD